MEPKIISSQIIVSPQQNIPTKVIGGSAQNFKRTPEPGDNYKRPLMLNAWSQTTGNDFSYLYELEHKQEQLKREKELLEKVRVLEENLKAHSELLSQIHATSARRSALQRQTQPEIKPFQIQSVESLSPAYQNSLDTSHVSPLKRGSHHPLYPPMGSVKYTIIAEGADDVHGEPIEIQWAEDDGHLNLNSSADSGRLEICLTPEEVEIKRESMPTSTNYQNDSLSENSNYYLNDQGVLTPSSGSVNCHSYSNHQESASKRRNSNNLLNTAKRKNSSTNGSPHIQSSPLQPIKHSTTLRYAALDSGVGIENNSNPENIMVSIGPNNTRIPAKVYEGMSWSSASIATRKLLMTVFDRNTLATHSMTGKPSPAFKDHGKPLKQMLDPSVVQDIIFAVTHRCNVSEKEVRSAITTKCADENKMMKVQMNKRTPMREIKNEV